MDDSYLDELASALTPRAGWQARYVPRLFVKELVADVLDRVDQFQDFDPRPDYSLTVLSTELTDFERNAATPDDVVLEL